MSSLRHAARRLPERRAAAQERRIPEIRSIASPTLAHLDILKAPSAAFFGDNSGVVVCARCTEGTLLWRTQVDTHPQARIVGAPTLYHERLYVVVSSNEQSAAADSNYACCTFRGSVAALDMMTGNVLWKTYASHRRAATVPSIRPQGATKNSDPPVAASGGAHHRHQAQFALRGHGRLVD